AGQLRHLPAAIDEAAGDGAAVRVAVRRDGERETFREFAVRQRRQIGLVPVIDDEIALIGAPAIIGARLAEIDFLHTGLADVGDQHLLGAAAVPTEALGIAQAARPYFRQHVLAAQEGIGGRN